ncbi:hypothetical protein Cni_G09024 [Canna indica]|uniref:Reverse transcriptase domain-containing protein n=1 Tax=Canna indica TaxID=4628 RepID=A0AAQ3K793_9LILI|nr:hypothetical protein Cni_G09024 [Canna indica]
MLVNRIRPWIRKLISKKQVAFIEKRRLQDNIVILSEVVDIVSRSKRKNPFFIINLDLEKAYDRVDWKALMGVCRLMNFPEKFIGWVKACLKAANYRCVLNGEQSEVFKSNKGVRQGDPLSPYLFIVLQELLSKLINREVEKGNLKVFKYKGMHISHLLFVDDIIMVIKCCESSCRCLIEVLNFYGKVTNQRINYGKSEVFFPCEFPKKRKEVFSRMLGIKEGGLPIKYLGAYVDKGKISVNVQRQMIEKAENRLESWASKDIFQAGKVVLINSVVNSMPIHTLSIMWINSKIIKEHEKLIRDFLWKLGKKKYGFHLVNWKKVSLCKAEGGLGVKDLNTFKIVIHAKRVLPILNRKDQIWSRLVNARYGDLHPWKKRRSRRIGWAMKGIVSAIEMLREGLKVKIGNGKKTNVWTDPWIESYPIEKWPTFVNMDKIQEVTMVNEFIRNGEWNLNLIKDVLGEEHMCKIRQLYLPSENIEDKWIWCLNRKGKLSCKIAYNFLKRKDYEMGGKKWKWGFLWALNLIPRIKMFLWKFFQGRIPTTELL